MFQKILSEVKISEPCFEKVSLASIIGICWLRQAGNPFKCIGIACNQLWFIAEQKAFSDRLLKWAKPPSLIEKWARNDSAHEFDPFCFGVPTIVSNDDIIWLFFYFMGVKFWNREQWKLFVFVLRPKISCPSSQLKNFSANVQIIVRIYERRF